jgi:hypothetical protein
MTVLLALPQADYIVALTYNVDGGNWMSWRQYVALPDLHKERMP